MASILVDKVLDLINTEVSKRWRDPWPQWWSCIVQTIHTPRNSTAIYLQNSSSRVAFITAQVHHHRCHFFWGDPAIPFSIDILVLFRVIGETWSFHKPKGKSRFSQLTLNRGISAGDTIEALGYQSTNGTSNLPRSHPDNADTCQLLEGAHGPYEPI